MSRYGLLVMGIIAAALPGGCATRGAPGSRLTLPDVSYKVAFATARAVMSKHFKVASADPTTGLILAKPKPVSARPERLLGGSSPARHVAKMRLGSGDGHVVVLVSVALQRQGASSYRQMQPGDDYSSVPNQTPAQDTAATTVEQNEAWQTQSHDRGLERQILNELYQALRPAKPQ